MLYSKKNKRIVCNLNQNHIFRFRFDPDLRAEVSRQIASKFPDENKEKILLDMEQIFHPENRHLITVFSLKADNNTSDIDEAIIDALIKAKKSNFHSMTRMCLEWDRVDVARKFIFTEDNLQFICLDGLMEYAIIKNRVAFVELFLETGYNIKNYSTYARLLHLYSQIPVSSDLFVLLKDQMPYGHISEQIEKDKQFLTFDAIGRVTQKLLRDLYSHRFTKPPFTLIDYGKYRDMISRSELVASRLVVIN